MPSYKTHSIHGELLMPKIKRNVNINKEDFKTFCMGPDALIVSDYNLFEYQHANKVREFFIRMLRIIKRNKLQSNEQVMAFLYGQIDHLVLDSTMHPFIYYMTEGLNNETMVPSHTLVEAWIDDYLNKKYEINDGAYYHTIGIYDKQLRFLIDKLYDDVFSSKNESIKYNLGYLSILLFDVLRRRKMLVGPLSRLFKIGDFTYKTDYKRAIPFLNKNNELWLNPETEEECYDSFDDLWNKSIETSLETIEDVNNYLYRDKKLKNPIILDDISYNTGLSCNMGQRLRFIKKW